MKRLFAICALAFGLMAACSKTDVDNTVPETPAGPALTEYYLRSSVSPETRLQWVDGEGITWDETADRTELGYFADCENAGSGQSQNLKIEDDGRATFTIATGDGASKAFTYYPFSGTKTWYSSENYDFSATFTIQGTQTLQAAGTFPMNSFPAKSRELLAINPGAQPLISNDMELLAGIVRLLVYTEKYGDEAVMLAALEVEGADINGDITVSGNLTDGTVTTGAVSGGTNRTSVVLSSDCELTGVTSLEDAAGIYMAVAPAQVTGYKYIVITNAAEYTFEASEARTFNADEILNVPLNLDNAVRKEQDNSHVFTWNSPEVPAVGTTFNLSADASKPSIGRLEASYDDAPVNYSDITFVFEDAEGQPVTWVSYEWPALEGAAFFIVAQRNPAQEPRTAYLYAEYNGLRAGERVELVQAAGTGVPHVVPYLVSNVADDKIIDDDGETIANAATLTIEVNGEPANVADYKQYITLSCTTVGAEAEVTLNDDGSIDIVFPSNQTNTTNNYTLSASTADGSASVRFVQAENEDGEDQPLYEYDFEKLSGYDTTAAFGVGAAATDIGRHFRIYNIKNPLGVAYEIPLNIPEGEVSDIMSQMFKYGTVTDDELNRYGDGATDYPEFLIPVAALQQGDSMYVDIHLEPNTTGKKRYSKLEVYDCDGVLQYTWLIWQDA